jgi:prepilin-type processing-associated H-X9-DG protein
MSFRIQLGDIAEVRADALVNYLYVDGHPNNRSNVCKSILHHLGQPGDPAYDHYVAHIDALPLQLGFDPDLCSVKGLFAPYIINAVSPKKEFDVLCYDGSYQRLSHLYHSVYTVALNRGLKHIVVPPLGAGIVCHYHQSESLLAATVAYEEYSHRLDVDFIVYYDAHKFQDLLSHLQNQDTPSFMEREANFQAVRPDYYSAPSVLDKLNAYVLAKYHVVDLFADADLKARVLAFVYNDMDATLRANKKKLSDPHQTISGRTAWLFACALRMNVWEFKDFCSYVNPNPPLSGEERSLAFASINWGLSDNLDVLSKAYEAMIGKPLFKNKE